MKHTIYKLNVDADSTLGVLPRRNYDRLLLDVWEAELEGSIDIRPRLRLIELLGATGFEEIPNSLEAIDQRILEILKETLRTDYRVSLRTQLVELLYGPNQCRLDEVSLRRQRMTKLFDDQAHCAQS